MQQTVQQRAVVASDWRFAACLVLGILNSGVALFNIVTWAWFTNFQYFDTTSALSIFLPLSVGVFSLFWALRFRALNLRRQAAANGDPAVPLALRQPVPNGAALPLPFTVRLIPRRGPSYILGSIAGAILLPICFGYLFQSLANPDDSFFITNIIFSIIFFSIAIGFAILLAIILIRYGYNKITATEAGLTIQERTTIRFIPWNEARLFAITRGIKRTGTPTFYELSSATTFGTPLLWLHPNTLIPPNMKPALPFDEYDGQMEALLSLIAAKTGLPLYDLR
jgi:hypothetical protein